MNLGILDCSRTVSVRNVPPLSGESAETLRSILEPMLSNLPEFDASLGRGIVLAVSAPEPGVVLLELQSQALCMTCQRLLDQLDFFGNRLSVELPVQDGLKYHLASGLGDSPTVAGSQGAVSSPVPMTRDKSSARNMVRRRGVQRQDNLLYVGGLPADIDCPTLTELFRGCGRVVSATFCPPERCIGQRVAHVRFRSRQEAKLARDTMNGLEYVTGSRLVVRFAGSRGISTCNSGSTDRRPDRGRDLSPGRGGDLVLRSGVKAASELVDGVSLSDAAGRPNLDIVTLFNAHRRLASSLVTDNGWGVPTVDAAAAHACLPLIDQAVRRARQELPQDSNVAVFYKAVAWTYMWGGSHDQAHCLLTDAQQILAHSLSSGKVTGNVFTDVELAACERLLSVCVPPQLPPPRWESKEPVANCRDTGASCANDLRKRTRKWRLTASTSDGNDSPLDAGISMPDDSNSFRREGPKEGYRCDDRFASRSRDRNLSSRSRSPCLLYRQRHPVATEKCTPPASLQFGALVPVATSQRPNSSCNGLIAPAAALSPCQASSMMQGLASAAEEWNKHQEWSAEAFAALDRDGNGYVTRAELLSAAREWMSECLDNELTPDVGVTPLQALLDFVFRRVDVDGNGRLTQAEFECFTRRIKYLAAEPDVLMDFARGTFMHANGCRLPLSDDIGSELGEEMRVRFAAIDKQFADQHHVLEHVTELLRRLGAFLLHCDVQADSRGTAVIRQS